MIVSIVIYSCVRACVCVCDLNQMFSFHVQSYKWPPLSCSCGHSKDYTQMPNILKVQLNPELKAPNHKPLGQSEAPSQVLLPENFSAPLRRDNVPELWICPSPLMRSKEASRSKPGGVKRSCVGVRLDLSEALVLYTGSAGGRWGGRG